MIGDQKHPLAHIDRAIVQQIFVEGKTDYNMAEVARLKIRYLNFPGARDIQRDLEVILTEWDINEEELFTHVKQLHRQGKVYRKVTDEDNEDWS